MILNLMLSQYFTSHSFQFLQDFLGSAVQLLGDSSLLAEIHLSELVAEIAVDCVFLGLDGAAEGLMVPAAERLGFDLQVHLEVHEEVDILAQIKRQHGAYGTHRRAKEDDFAGASSELALLDGSTDLAEEELVYLLHFEGCTIEVAVLPLKLGGRRVILSVLLATGWKSVDKEVFELVDPSQGIFVEHAEIGQPPIEDVVGKNVELPLVWLKFQNTY